MIVHPRCQWRDTYTNENRHRHREPPAVRQGSRRVAAAARARTRRCSSTRASTTTTSCRGSSSTSSGSPRPTASSACTAGPTPTRPRGCWPRSSRSSRELQPDMVLVYGDTNSTLAGALAAAQRRIPVAHVEAGMRSFDRSMPEELNRVLTDHASDLLLCSTDDRGREPAQRVGGRAGRAGRRRDGRRDAAVRADRRASARRRCATTDVEPGRLRAGDRAPRRQRRRTRAARAAGRAARGAAARRRAAAAPAHARAARGRPGCSTGSRRRRGLRLTPPLGYLDTLELARNARAVLTDSGGLQKEAYLLATPCVTLRPSTEWVETVEAGWNVLVDLDRDGRARRDRPRSARRRAARAVRRRPRGRARSPTPSVSTLPGHEGRDHRARLRRAAAGGRLLRGRARGDRPRHRPAQDRGDRGGRELHRGRRRRAPARDRRARFRATTRYADLSKADAVDHRRADAAHREPRARPGPADRRRRTSLSRVLQEGQLVVLESTTYPGTTRERLVPLLEESGPRGRPRLQRRVLARARRPGPHRLHDAQHAEGRRRAHARVPRARARPVRRGLRRASCRSRRPRRPS